MPIPIIDEENKIYTKPVSSFQSIFVLNNHEPPEIQIWVNKAQISIKKI